MRHFIILTHEGLTKTPGYSDIENLQVLGFTDGKNEESALANFKKESKYLKHADYVEAFAMELLNEKQYHFSLKSQ